MVSINFKYDNELQNELLHIDRNIINKATARALKEIARPVLKTIKAQAPTDTRVLQQKMSLTSSVDKGRGVAVVYAGLSKKNHPGWLITRGLAMEYGNTVVMPQSFIMRAARQHRTPVYRSFREFMDKHLDRLL